MTMLMSQINWKIRKTFRSTGMGRASAYVIVRTPLFNGYRDFLLSTRYRSKTRSFLDNLLYRDVLNEWLQHEYWSEKDPHVRDRKKMQLISAGSSTWAATYETQEPFSLSLPYRQDKTRTTGEAQPVYESMLRHIEANKDQRDCVIIQIGTASGRELHWLANQFPGVRCIGADGFEGAVNHANATYKASNLEYTVMPLEKAKDLLEEHRDRHIVFFTSGLFHFVQPEFVDEFFGYVGQRDNIEMFISEPVTLSQLSREAFPKGSTPRWKPMSWTHNYPRMLEKNGISIRELVLTNCVPDPNDLHAINCFIRAGASVQQEDAAVYDQETVKVESLAD